MNPQNQQPSEQQPENTQDVAGVVDDVTALNQAFPAKDRRQSPRLKYKVVATLESVAVGPEEISVVTRDADERGTGFVSSTPITEGTRAVLHLPSPDGEGETQRIECRVRRSRELGNGLFEGSVEFLGDQPQFSDTRIKAQAKKPTRS
jgi:hypothetical protein